MTLPQMFNAKQSRKADKPELVIPQIKPLFHLKMSGFEIPTHQ